MILGHENEALKSKSLIFFCIWQKSPCNKNPPIYMHIKSGLLITWHSYCGVELYVPFHTPSWLPFPKLTLPYVIGVIILVGRVEHVRSHMPPFNRRSSYRFWRVVENERRLGWRAAVSQPILDGLDGTLQASLRCRRGWGGGRNEDWWIGDGSTTVVRGRGGFSWGDAGH